MSELRVAHQYWVLRSNRDRIGLLLQTEDWTHSWLEFHNNSIRSYAYVSTDELSDGPSNPVRLHLKKHLGSTHSVFGIETKKTS